MARNYGKIKVEVWEPGSDYRQLSLEAQWAYQMLISQESVSMVGSLLYTPRKWAKLAAGLDTGRVEAIIGQLEQAWYVIVDHDTGELLVRSFIKHDEGWRLPNLLTGARLAFRALESEAIRDYLARRHPWLVDSSLGKDDIDAYERDQPASERTISLPLDTGMATGVDTGVDTAVDTDVATGGGLARTRGRAPSPAPTPAPSKGRGVGAGTTRARDSAPPAAQEAAPSARVVDEESGQIAVRAECPICGPLHDVGTGFDLGDHIANVHGRDPDEVLAPLIGRDVA